MKCYFIKGLVLLSSVLLVAGCAEHSETSVKKESNHWRHDWTETAHKHHHHYTNERLTEVAINTLDDLTAKAHAVIVGTVTGEEQIHDSGVYRFTVAVQDVIKGSVVSETIYVYEGIGNLITGKEYILFLESCEDALYPNTLHTTITSESIIEVNGNTLIGEEKFIGNQSKEQLIAHVQSLPPLTTY